MGRGVDTTVLTAIHTADGRDICPRNLRPRVEDFIRNVPNSFGSNFEIALVPRERYRRDEASESLNRFPLNIAEQLRIERSVCGQIHGDTKLGFEKAPKAN